MYVSGHNQIATQSVICPVSCSFCELDSWHRGVIANDQSLVFEIELECYMSLWIACVKQTIVYRQLLRYGRVVRALTTDIEGPEFKTACALDI